MIHSDTTGTWICEICPEWTEFTTWEAIKFHNDIVHRPVISS